MARSRSRCRITSPNLCDHRDVWRVTCLAAVAIASASATPARADAPAPGTVALLPLDADRSLELYGQPVASEIARALGAGGIEVVVVGPKMAVPEGARVIVDGTIKAGAGDTVALAVRVRRRADGAILDTIEAATALATIDRGAHDVAARLLPSVRAQLVAIAAAAPAPAIATAPHRPPPPAPTPIPATAVIAKGARATELEPLRAALVVAADAWSRAQPAPLALAFEVERYTVEVARGVPIARARVRLVAGDPAAPRFDRVIVTDSVVGARDHADALPAIVAREVVAIATGRLRARRSGS